MYLVMRASEPTLELGLQSLQRQVEQGNKWLERLEADWIEAGSPQFDDLTALTGTERMTAEYVRCRGRKTKEQPSAVRNVLCGITATWDIEDLTAEEIIFLMDKIRLEGLDEFEEKEEEPDPTEDWGNPRDIMRRVQEMTESMAENNKEDIRFVFIYRASEEEYQELAKQAFTEATRRCEKLAQLANMNLDGLASLSEQMRDADLRDSGKLVERQKLMSLVSQSSYRLSENESCLEVPAPVELAVKVSLSYYAIY